MKMPAKLKREWVKALKSGEYGQTDGILCNGNGGFCCLGVLEHVAMDGEIETHLDGSYKAFPTNEFYEYAGIEVEIRNWDVSDKVVETLAEMNDGTGKYYKGSLSFEEIAEWIKYNIETI